MRHGVTVIAGAPAMWAAWADLPDAGASAFADRADRHLRRGPAPRRGGRAACESRFGVSLRRGLRPHRGVARWSPPRPASSTGRARSARRCPASRSAWSTPTATTCSSATPARSGCGARTCSRATGTTPRPPRTALTDDGWLRTGDIAVVDDDGFLYLVDRAKDLIIVSGFNVYPAEVEEVLLEHPAIERCAVVGVPHPHSGEAVKAYVVVAAGHVDRGGRGHRVLRPTGSPATSAPRR